MFSLKKGFGSKKANFMVDIIFVIVMLCIIAVVIAAGYLVLDKTNDAFQASDSIPEIAKNETQKNYDSFNNWTDSLVLILMVGGFIAALVLAWFLDNSPVVLFVGFLFLVIIVILAAVISNSFVSALEDPVFAFQESFPLTYWILTHLVEIAAGYLLCGLVVMFAKGRSAA